MFNVSIHLKGKWGPILDRKNVTEKQVIKFLTYGLQFDNLDMVSIWNVETGAVIDFEQVWGGGFMSGKRSTIW